MAKFSETINNETGENSYIIFQPGLISEVPPSTPDVIKGTMTMSLGIPMLKGEFPLHNVNVWLLDHTGSYAIDTVRYFLMKSAE